MARYIDADTMQDFLVETNDIDDWCVSLYNADWISSFIESQPTADVVEVVRCKNCKYGDVSVFSKTKDGQEEIACYCNLKKVVTYVDSYCPSGRKNRGD